VSKGAEAYIRYAEHPRSRHDAGDRTFCEAINMVVGTGVEIVADDAPAAAAALPPCPAVACSTTSRTRWKVLGYVVLSLVLHLTLIGVVLLWRPVPREPVPLHASVVFLDLREMDTAGHEPVATAAAESDTAIETSRKINPSPISPAARKVVGPRRVVPASAGAAAAVLSPAEAAPRDATGEGGEVAERPVATMGTASISGGASAPLALASEAELIPARPHARHSPAPPYPEAARRRGQQGLVHLAAEVAADGRVQALELAESCGYALLDRAALAAVREWIFEPARRRGVAETARVVVPVRFELH